MAKIDEVLSELRKTNVKLYGENGFEGDIPELKRDVKGILTHLEDHSKRITIVETLQKERGRPSKKTLAGYGSAIIAICLALWKAWTKTP